ncbi:MAG: hypothetical protein DRO95_06180 [Candidatus Altiarchaeales archaeon]|nr:MAG: hypothetical protein DRO95_06180 [Candidatus Altiarchaeales archaeon]
MKNLRILYKDEAVVDCTADPHRLSYSTRKRMLDDVEKVLESDLVAAITSITVYDHTDKVIAATDHFMDVDIHKKNKLMKGAYARKHKIEGLYFVSDAEEDHPNAMKLPPGLTGFKLLKKRLIEPIPNHPLENAAEVNIGVMWSAFMQHNCSDYIRIHLMDNVVDYSNQDWYQGERGYSAHLNRLAELLGVSVDELKNDY